MSVTNQTPVNAFTANGVTTVFNFTFQVLDSSDLRVQVDDEDKIIGSEYTVSGVGNQAGGSVTFLSAPASSASVVVFRDSVLERGTDYQNNGDLRAATVNNDFDRIWLALQEVLYGIQLAPTLRPGSPLSGTITLPDPGPSKYLRWNLTGTGLEAVDGTGTAPGEFIHSGAGAIPRPIQSKVGDVVSVEDFDSDAHFDAARELLAGRNDLVVRPSTSSTDMLLSEALGRLDTKPTYLSRPAFIEQHISGFFGRGMLTAEAINVSTEQALTANVSAGAALLACADATHFVVGSCVSVKHDNGRYNTYFITSKTGNDIGISPSLRYACSVATARIERTWYNRAHPGKFYMRELAQRIARSSELDAAMPNGGRVLYTNLSSNPTSAEDTLVAVGGTTINYYNASNVGSSGGVDFPVRFTFGRTAYVEGFSAVGHGAETPLFSTHGATGCVVKVIFRAEGGGRTYAFSVINEAGEVLGESSTASVNDQFVFQTYTFCADLRGAESIKIKIAAKTYSAAGGDFSLAQVDVFEVPTTTGVIIKNRASKIVCLGDSWVSGDLGGSAEREPITQQLSVELPYSTIINAGVGGNKIWEELARFDSDVAVHTPDYVVLNTGTNECYNPSSGIFDPNSIDGFLMYYGQLLSKISSIGARAIIIGVPALAQSDADVPGFPEWQLNDRAKAYARYFFEWQSQKPVIMSGSNANGSWVKYADGSLIQRRTINVTTSAALTLGIATWNYPIPFIAAPTITTSTSGYSTGQLISTGTDTPGTASAAIKMMTGTAGVTLPVDCIAVGRWR